MLVFQKRLQYIPTTVDLNINDFEKEFFLPSNKAEWTDQQMDNITTYAHCHTRAVKSPAKSYVVECLNLANGNTA